MTDIHIGQVIDGKYRISRLIGQGGMGAVYEGVNELIDRRVAIKVLLAHADESAGTRFQQEARAAGRIGNDHILEILDIGTLPGGAKYMVCELLDGQPLSDRIAERGQVAPVEIIPIVEQLLTGLGAAHDAGILHRDLKPDNVFVLREKAGKRDFVKLIDFGISKFTESPGSESMSMTKTGMLVGTPFYMSPEQARGVKEVDHRSDLYAVGVILYEALAGRVPFFAESFNDLLFKVVLEAPPPIEEHVPGLDPAIVAIVNKAMARNPDERYQSARAFREVLLAWMEENGVAEPPRTSRARIDPMPSLGPSSSLPHAAAATPPFQRTSVGEPTPQGTALPAGAPSFGAVPTPGAFGGTTGGAAAYLPRGQDKRTWLIAGALVALSAIGGGVWALSSGDDASEDLDAAAGDDGSAVPVTASQERAVEDEAADPEASEETAPGRPSPAAGSPEPDSTKRDSSGSGSTESAAGDRDAKDEASKAGPGARPPSPAPSSVPSTTRPAPRPQPARPAPAPVAAPPRPTPRPAVPPAPTPRPAPRDEFDFGY